MMTCKLVKETHFLTQNCQEFLHWDYLDNTPNNQYRSFWSERDFASSISNDEFYLFYLEKKIVGYLILKTMDESSSEILNFVIHPKYRSRGLGKLGLDIFIKTVCDQKIWLEVHEKNIKAIKTYENVGFVFQSKRKRYYKDLSDALLYQYLP